MNPGVSKMLQGPCPLMILCPSYLHDVPAARKSAEVTEVGLDKISHQLFLLFCKHLSGISNGSCAVAVLLVTFLLYFILTGLVLPDIFAFYVAQYSE